MYLSDVIKPIEYLNWGNADIYIQAPTGCGKTHFILNEIIPMAVQQGKGILILCNRRNLLQQYVTDIEKKEVDLLQHGDFRLHNYMRNGLLHVTTYQAVAESIQIDQIIGRLEIIICDEVHALYSDSQFATGLYKAFIKIINWSISRLTMYVSATAEKIFPLLYTAKFQKMFPSLYCDQPDWSRHQSFPGYYQIDKCYDHCRVHYLHGIEQISTLIKNEQDIESKWMIFVPSIQEGKKIVNGLRQLGLKDVFLLTKESAASERGQRISNQLTSLHTFECKILISTLVLEAGVSICGLDVNNIVNLHFGEDYFIQTLGRKRVGKDEKIDLYIMNRGKQFFAGKLNFCNQILKEVNVANYESRNPSKFQSYISRRLLEQKGNEALKSFLYWDEAFAINPISISKAQQDSLFYKSVLNKLDNDENAFIKEQLAWMGVEDTYSSDNWVDEHKSERCRNELKEYFEKYVGGEPMELKVFSEFKKTFAKILHEFYPDEQFRSNRSVSTKKLLQKIEELGLPYTVSTKIVNRNKLYTIKQN